jgi:hypothetical protein
MARSSALPPNLPPRLICREAAAEYAGVGATLFDRLVREGQMPPAKRLAGRKVWDTRILDRAIDALPSEATSSGNSWAGVVE